MNARLLEDRRPADDMRLSRRILIVEGALAAVMLTLGSGNFMVGFLSEIGASAGEIALITAIPNLGCVLQIIAPLYFEKKTKRKGAVILFCFLFRFLMGFTVFSPYLFSSGTARRGFAFTLYAIAYLLAGFVTPALNQWIMQIAPQERRGRYFAVKGITAQFANAGIAFLMGRLLDRQIVAGTPMHGYVEIYGFCIVGSLIDLFLMLQMKEPPAAQATLVRLSDLPQPFRDQHFRPILVFEIISYISMMLSAGYLSVYQIEVIGLSHTMITGIGIFSMAVGMAGTWIWGKVSDRRGWTVTILGTHLISALCLLAWWLTPLSTAKAVAPVIMILSAMGNGAAGMAGTALQYDHAPEGWKTTYLGATAAAGSLMGYTALLLGSALQKALEPRMGCGSMTAMFLLSAVISLAGILYGKHRLPKA